MLPDPWFRRELKILDESIFATWHPKKRRWQIRVWVLPHRRGAERNYYEWKNRSSLVRTVCYLDENGYDIGYHPLDQRVLYALKLSRKLDLSPGGAARMVDESNKKLEAEWAADNADISKEVATSIWNHYRQPSIDLGQRSAR